MDGWGECQQRAQMRRSSSREQGEGRKQNHREAVRHHAPEGWDHLPIFHLQINFQISEERKSDPGMEGEMDRRLKLFYPGVSWLRAPTDSIVKLSSLQL